MHLLGTDLFANIRLYMNIYIHIYVLHMLDAPALSCCDLLVAKLWFDYLPQLKSSNSTMYIHIHIHIQTYLHTYVYVSSIVSYIHASTMAFIHPSLSQQLQTDLHVYQIKAANLFINAYKDSELIYKISNNKYQWITKRMQSFNYIYTL